MSLPKHKTPSGKARSSATTWRTSKRPSRSESIRRTIRCGRVCRCSWTGCLTPADSATTRFPSASHVATIGHWQRFVSVIFSKVRCLGTRKEKESMETVATESSGHAMVWLPGEHHGRDKPANTQSQRALRAFLRSRREFSTGFSRR